MPFGSCLSGPTVGALRPKAITRLALPSSSQEAFAVLRDA
jgi:hypothetical protein